MQDPLAKKKSESLESRIVQDRLVSISKEECESRFVEHLWEILKVQKRYDRRVSFQLDVEERDLPVWEELFSIIPSDFQKKKRVPAPPLAPNQRLSLFSFTLSILPLFFSVLYPTPTTHHQKSKNEVDVLFRKRPCHSPAIIKRNTRRS
jgi:hypothetical protein